MCATISATAVVYFASRGHLLYYGDAQAHLNIARRIWDSRTPGFDQIGTVWLPLPHVAMLPFVGNNEWWRSGLAGAFPSAAFFVLGCVFLFTATRAAFQNRGSAWVAVLVVALNPNLLYLQAIPMTEAMFFGCSMALLFFTVAFSRKPSVWFAAGAGVAAFAGSLTRYEGWFVIPFAALFFLLAGRGNRLVAAAVFLAIALAGPLAWLAHNRYYWGDFLEFCHGPNSARAIQGDAAYPGRGDWAQAVAQFRAAAALCAGWPTLILGAAGLLAALSRKRAIWPLILLALPACFYVMSIHSGSTPIFVPTLSPNSYYNTRYGIVLLPLGAFAAGALAAVAPRRLESWIARIAIALAVGPWLYYHNPQDWITWKESEVNSQARRAWTTQAAAYLKEKYSP
ncbi:MAG: glycosyltransferase family 39 protein, partial [Bryobacteraceae bacterium]